MEAVRITGVNGISGLNGISGFSGVSGVNGLSGLSGLNGLNGLNGLKDLNGFNGDKNRIRIDRIGIMNADEIKRQMMQLWKETFHDTDRYIEMVFDNYFDMNRIVYKVINGEIVSALLSVPYVFELKKGAYIIIDDYNLNLNSKCIYDSNPEYNLCSYVCDMIPLRRQNILSETVNSVRVKGLYLCGLATKPEYRGRGIISSQMREIEQRAYADNFAFTFLIPANERLVNFYAQYKYINICDRCKIYLNITDNNINSTSKNNNKIKEYNSEKECENINKIALFISENECNVICNNIVHSTKDIRLFLSDELASDSKIITILSDNADDIVSCYILRRNEDNEVPYSIPFFVNSDIVTIASDLQIIGRHYGVKSLELYCNPEITTKIEKNLRIGGVEVVSSMVQRYGMLKFLNTSQQPSSDLRKNENREFLNSKSYNLENQNLGALENSNPDEPVSATDPFQEKNNKFLNIGISMMLD